MSTEPNSRLPFWLQILLWVMAAGSLAVVLFLVLVWMMTARVSGEARAAAKGIAENFQRAFNFTPEVKVNSMVVIESAAPVMELVTLQKKVLVRYLWNHTWMHSTKTFELEADVTAKVGFDLSEPFRIEIDPRTMAVTAILPKPKLLSVEIGDLRIIKDEDGLWNKLTAEDREGAFRGLQAEARRKTDTPAVLNEAVQEADKRFRGLLELPKSKPTPIP